ncbi:MAG TPA: PIN domain-containing protein [Bryobacteraceae bacterium]|jgi:hypothetical protein|nr:PIN domain-containing protein [Bryobacteraceae bacterium]
MAGRLIIVTSAITMLEMLSSQMSGEHKDAFGRIFSDPNLQMVDLDRRVAGKAAAIRSHYDDRKYKPDGSVSSGGIMGMGDAIHLATAIHFEVAEFQTLDGSGKNKRRFDHLRLDGSVAGARLSIKMPKYVPPLEPLKGPVSSVAGSQTELFEKSRPEDSPADVPSDYSTTTAKAGDDRATAEAAKKDSRDRQ